MARARITVDARPLLGFLLAAATANVLGERRQIALANGAFQDAFNGLAVHLYEFQ